MYLEQIVHTCVFGDAPLELAAHSLMEAGADGVDLSVRHRGINTAQYLLRRENRQLLKDCGLKVRAVTPLLIEDELDLSSDDPTIRNRALSFAKSGVDVAAFYGCDRMLVTPSRARITEQDFSDYAARWKRACGSVAQLAAYAAGQGVQLMLEPMNRFRVTLIHTVEDALRMIAETGAENVGIVPDTFHANMEEGEGICAALKRGGKRVLCLHLGDNNRACPGGGCLNWQAILETLKQLQFDGPLSHEPLTLYHNPERAAVDAAYRQNYVKQLKGGITYLREIMAKL